MRVRMKNKNINFDKEGDEAVRAAQLTLLINE